MLFRSIKHFSIVNPQNDSKKIENEEFKRRYFAEPFYNDTKPDISNYKSNLSNKNEVDYNIQSINNTEELIDVKEDYFNDFEEEYNEDSDYLQKEDILDDDYEVNKEMLNNINENFEIKSKIVLDQNPENIDIIPKPLVIDLPKKPLVVTVYDTKEESKAVNLISTDRKSVV